LEKIVSFQLTTHLSNNEIIKNDQFGFQPKLGTRDALIKFAQQAFAALDKSNAILGVFIDFSKAFDTIDHTILIHKLRKFYNFSENTISWFSSYLTNRTQCVQVGNSQSTFLPITCGVPQGSILGPTLFILYINDLTNFTPIFNTILYADDTNLFFESRDINLNMDQIQTGLDNVVGWCDANKLTLNLDKTHYIILKNYQNPFQLSKSVIMKNYQLEEAQTVRFLGVKIDNRLSWMRADLRSILGLMFHASQVLPTKVLILLYNALVNSKIVYCIEVWGNAPKTHLNSIHIMQKRLLRIIYKKHSRFHSVSLFKIAKVLPIHQLYLLRILLIAHDTFFHLIFYSSF